MPIRIKVDEDLPKDIADLFRSYANDAMTVGEQGLSGLPDEVIWEAVKLERRWLITADKGFADARLLEQASGISIVLLRLPRESRDGYVGLVRTLLDEVELETLGDCIIVVDPDSIRSHRPGSGGSVIPLARPKERPDSANNV